MNQTYWHRIGLRKVDLVHNLVILDNYSICENITMITVGCCGFLLFSRTRNPDRFFKCMCLGQIQQKLVWVWINVSTCLPSSLVTLLFDPLLWFIVLNCPTHTHVHTHTHTHKERERERERERNTLTQTNALYSEHGFVPIPCDLIFPTERG